MLFPSDTSACKPPGKRSSLKPTPQTGTPWAYPRRVPNHEPYNPETPNSQPQTQSPQPIPVYGKDSVRKLQPSLRTVWGSRFQALGSGFGVLVIAKFSVRDFFLSKLLGFGGVVGVGLVQHSVPVYRWDFRLRDRWSRDSVVLLKLQGT